MKNKNQILILLLLVFISSSVFADLVVSPSQFTVNAHGGETITQSLEVKNTGIYNTKVSMHYKNLDLNEDLNGFEISFDSNNFWLNSNETKQVTATIILAQNTKPYPYVIGFYAEATEEDQASAVVVFPVYSGGGGGGTTWRTVFVTEDKNVFVYIQDENVIKSLNELIQDWNNLLIENINGKTLLENSLIDLNESFQVQKTENDLLKQELKKMQEELSQGKQVQSKENNINYFLVVVLVLSLILNYFLLLRGRDKPEEVLTTQDKNFKLKNEAVEALLGRKP